MVVWGKLADLCGKYLSKGRQVCLEGILQTRSWEDQQGEEYTTEVVAQNVQFLSGGASAGQGQSSGLDFPSQEFGPEPSFDGSGGIPF